MSKLTPPLGWKTKKLADIADYHNGAAFKAKDWGEDGLPIIRIEQLNSEYADTDKYSGPLLPINYIDDGDLIFSWSATLKVVIWTRGPGALNQHLYKVVPKSGINKYLLRHLFDFNMEKLAGQSQGSTMKHVTRKELSRFSVILPERENHQAKIASILEVIDQAIEKTEALIHKYQQIKAGLMHDLFTRGLTADGKLRPPREQAPELYQETPIGWIPKAWAFELLDRLTDRGSGHTPNRNIPGYWNGGVKWISLSDSRRLDKLYISDTDFEISQLGIQNSSAVLQSAGVVVMSRDAGVGKSAITTEPMAVSQHFMCWKCGSKMDNHFLYYWLQFKKRMFENIAMGSTIVTIGLPYFKRLKIAAPKKLAEQEEIGKRLKVVDTYIFSMQSELAKLKKQKSGLMHDLLTGKVPVTVHPEEVTHGS